MQTGGVIGVVLVSLCCSILPADELKLPAQILTIQQSTEALQQLCNRIQARHDGEPDIINTARSIHNSANFLQQRWDRAKAQVIQAIRKEALENHQVVPNLAQEVNKRLTTKEYDESVMYDLTLLEYASDSYRQSRQGEELVSALHDVDDDLKVKANQCRSSGPTGLAPSVNVAVNTQKEQETVNGYLVRCNPRRWASTRPALYAFTDPSSPTHRSLPPGNFKMWVEKDAQEQKQVDITIGGDGKPNQTIPFPVK